MRKACIVGIVSFVPCLSATDPAIVTATPVTVTAASCNGPRGKATLAMPQNPFTIGQWITVREVPSSAPIIVTEEAVATGDGSRQTFTFRTASYPIRHQSITLLVGGVAQETD